MLEVDDSSAPRILDTEQRLDHHLVNYVSVLKHSKDCQIYYIAADGGPLCITKCVSFTTTTTGMGKVTILRLLGAQYAENLEINIISCCILES